MRRQRRTLDDYFSAARGEQSPVSAEDLRRMVDLPSNPIPQGPTMMTKILGISTAALAAAAGASILIIHDGSDTGKKLTVDSVMPATKAPEQLASLADPVHTDDRITTNTSHTTIGKPAEAPTPPMPPLPPVTALEADATILLALDLKEDCLRQIATAIEQVPTAFGACSDNTPRPIMVTSANGRGHVVLQRGTIANANTLIPVAAKNGDDDVLMWFPPTQDFMKSLPDSLVKPLEEVLEMDIHVTDDGGQMTVRRKHRNDDGTMAETEDIIGLSDMKSMMKRLDGKQNDPALAKHMQLLRKQLKNMMDDSSRIVFDKDSLPYLLQDIPAPVDMVEVDAPEFDAKVDSILAEMPKHQMMVDSIMKDFPNVQMRIDSVMKNMPMMQMKIDSIMKDFPAKQRMIDSIMKTMPNTRLMIKRFGKDSVVDIQIDMDSATTTMPNSHVIIKRMDAKPLQYKIDTRINVTDSTTRSTKSMHVRSRVQVLRSPAARGGIIVLSRRDVMNEPEVKAGAVTGLQETWRETSGAVETTGVFPNPTSDGGATMSFALAEDRNVSISLHDLTGAKVMDLVRNSPRKAGTGQLAFTLPGVTPGMYLVTLTTDRGERAVQRLIVQ